MERLLARGYNQGPRPSGHVVSGKWRRRQGGAIPPNLIIAANTMSTDEYLQACRQHALEVHPARFVRAIPEFFIRFLTRSGDTILDPFAGSNVVGKVAEDLGRKWISVEINETYVAGSSYRFQRVNSKPLGEYFKRRRRPM
jgi:site-specific DNA-methyltransferase (cytosine-N4-specific)